MDFANVNSPISGFSTKIVPNFFQFKKISVIRGHPVPRHAPSDFQTFRRHWRYLYDKIDSQSNKISQLPDRKFKNMDDFFINLEIFTMSENPWKIILLPVCTCSWKRPKLTRIEITQRFDIRSRNLYQIRTDVETNVKLLLQNKIVIMKTFLPSFHWCDSLKKIE